MDHQVTSSAQSIPLFDEDPAAAGAWASVDVERAAIYQEIADRRAQVECAETLRRARAL